MLTIKNYNELTMQTIELSNMDLYQIDYINEYEECYSIGLSNLFKGKISVVRLMRESNVKGPLTDMPYYKLECIETKKHILIIKDELKSYFKFQQQIKQLLDILN